MQVFTSKVNNHPLWWDNQCAELKYANYKFLQEFRKSDVDNDYETYIIARNKFKALCKKKQLSYKKHQRLITIFHNYFNNILITGVFSYSWSQSIICQIFKSGSKSNPSNYRGISITSTMYEIFSSIINNRLYH